MEPGIQSNASTGASACSFRVTVADRFLRRRVGAVADSALITRGRAVRILAREEPKDGPDYLLPKLDVSRGSLAAAP